MFNEKSVYSAAHSDTATRRIFSTKMRYALRIIKCAVDSEGALKMLDVKMTDMKLTDQCAGHEIAGHEIAGHKRAGYETDSKAANV